MFELLKRMIVFFGVIFLSVKFFLLSFENVVIGWLFVLLMRMLLFVIIDCV